MRLFLISIRLFYVWAKHRQVNVCALTALTSSNKEREVWLNCLRPFGHYTVVEVGKGDHQFEKKKLFFADSLIEKLGIGFL